MNDEANLVLSMELEEKVNEKIKQVLQTTIGTNPYYYATIIGQALVNDPSFVSSMTRQIGQRMSNQY